VQDPRILAGAETGDDAGVFALHEGLALVQTVDLITPVVDDPYQFGQVAASNALSDIYAMGAVPLTALNVAAFPPDDVPLGTLRAILHGAHDKVREAGAVILGGHTLNDPALKFGLSVTGTCDPRAYLSNSGARPGDLLVLTKPIGTGVLIGAYRSGWLDEDGTHMLVRNMAALNDIAGRMALSREARAATDITGFGLAGHASELAGRSAVAICLWFDKIPVYHEVFTFIERGVNTIITSENRRHVAGSIRVAGDISATEEQLLYDPQTSGGLLVSIGSDEAVGYVEALRNAGVEAAAIVGEVVEAGEPYLDVTRS
tara:strand:+ start:67 stop:1014 length:948 start_codon:yes stop_codon:yes gene_type:complete